MSSIASRVAALRAARRISQRALAVEMGVSQPTIANIERGRTEEIKGYVLESLARCLNTTPQYILNGESEQGAADEAASQAELVGIWKKLPQPHKDTLIQTARAFSRPPKYRRPRSRRPSSRATRKHADNRHRLSLSRLKRGAEDFIAP